MLTTLSTRPRTAAQDLVGLLAECHERIRRFVALANETATHPDAQPAETARACADVERYFNEALPLHVADEEESIAPRLRGLSSRVDEALVTMARQHRVHVRKLELLLQATGKVRSNPRRESAREELSKAAKALELELHDHLTLEESVIFPAIRQQLPRETQALIIDELRQRRRARQSPPAPAAQQEDS